LSFTVWVGSSASTNVGGSVRLSRYTDTERTRSWLLADRLLRLHAATWLGAAGLTESADRLRRLGSIATDTQLVRGVHLLGNALGTASRRLETTQAIAGGRADVVDALAWDLWEEVCQRTGGAATAEAVVHGVPGSLTFATDQRVMELSRDPEHRSELESSTRGLGDEVWSTALAEVAATAWRTGWEAAEALVHHESTFSMRTTLRRTLQGIIGDDDDIALDMLLDDVDATARDTIARLLLVGDDQSDYWDKAMSACAGVGDLPHDRRVQGAAPARLVLVALEPVEHERAADVRERRSCGPAHLDAAATVLVRSRPGVPADDPPIGGSGPVVAAVAVAVGGHLHADACAAPDCR